MDNNIVLIYGSSGSGKSSSLRHLDFDSTVLINIEGKMLPIRGASKMRQEVPKNLTEVKVAIKKAVDDDSVKTIIFDSLTMFGDNILYPELVRDVPDSRSGWLDYRDAISGMLEYCKKSGKSFIFIALASDVLNEKEAVLKTVPAIQGSMKNSLSSHFTVVLKTNVLVEDGELRYVFQTNKTAKDKDNEAKSPFGLFDELYIDNDVKLVFDSIDEYR
jgi:energy-coupling factor transporter ATP-binding protein EcfA2